MIAGVVNTGDKFITRWWGWVVKVVAWAARLVECPLAKAVHKWGRYKQRSGAPHIQYCSPPQKIKQVILQFFLFIYAKFIQDWNGKMGEYFTYSCTTNCVRVIICGNVLRSSLHIE